MTGVGKSGKPLGGKSYGSIAHLPGSRMGPGDHHCHEGQARIACEKVRDKHDVVIVQEKLDGSNVGVARIAGSIVALTRAGYVADTSPYPQHHRWMEWVAANANRFESVIGDGERLCGEWLLQAHGTRYNLPHEPFVAFDLMRGQSRTPFDEFTRRVAGKFQVPRTLHVGGPLSVEAAMDRLGEFGFHGALDAVEGCVWRVERKGDVDFLTKYVRPDKVDGKYLPELNGGETVWNTYRGDV